jgi:hypothetical protein
VSPEETRDARNNILFKLKKIRVELLGKEAGEADGWGALGCEPAPLVTSSDGDAAAHDEGGCE